MVTSQFILKMDKHPAKVFKISVLLNHYNYSTHWYYSLVLYIVNSIGDWVAHDPMNHELAVCCWLGRQERKEKFTFTTTEDIDVEKLPRLD